MVRPKNAFFHSCFLYLLLYFYNVLTLFYITFFIFYYTFFNIYQLNLIVKLCQNSYPSPQKYYPTVKIAIIHTLLSDHLLPRKIKTYSNFPNPKIKTYDNFPKQKISTYNRLSKTKNKDLQATNGSAIFPFTPASFCRAASTAARVVQAMPALLALPYQSPIPKRRDLPFSCTIPKKSQPALTPFIPCL